MSKSSLADGGDTTDSPGVEERAAAGVEVLSIDSRPDVELGGGVLQFLVKAKAWLCTENGHKANEYYMCVRLYYLYYITYNMRN